MKYFERTSAMMRKTPYMATIYDGHSHIERRVYEDSDGYRYVRINGFYWDVDFELTHYDVSVWYDG